MSLHYSNNILLLLLRKNVFLYGRAVTTIDIEGDKLFPPIIRNGQIAQKHLIFLMLALLHSITLCSECF